MTKNNNLHQHILKKIIWPRKNLRVRHTNVRNVHEKEAKLGILN